MSAELAVAAFVALFGGGGLVALLKLRSDSSLTIVSAAQGAVVIQTSVIDELQEGQAALRAQMVEVQQRALAAEERAVVAEAKVVNAERRADNAERQREAVLRANADLMARLDQLEREVRRLGGDP